MAITKTWVWSGKGPRHKEMNGQTVGAYEAFSNGLQYPGDPKGGAKHNANCKCSLKVLDTESGNKPDKFPGSQETVQAAGTVVDAPTGLSMLKMDGAQRAFRSWQRHAGWREKLQANLRSGLDLQDQKYFYAPYRAGGEWNFSATESSMVESIDSAMGPLPGGVTLYTRMEIQELDSLLLNGSKVEQGYISASHKPGWPEGAGGVEVELKVAKGTDAISFRSVKQFSEKDEIDTDESLIGRSNRMTVISDFTDASGVRKVTVDVRPEYKVATKPDLPPPSSTPAEIADFGDDLPSSLNKSIEIEEPDFMDPALLDDAADELLMEWEARRDMMINRYAQFKKDGVLKPAVIEKYKDSVQMFAGNRNYAQIQQAIIHGDAADVHASRKLAAKELLELFNEVPALQKEWTAWRGMSIDESAMTPGALIENKALTSLSVDHNVSAFHALRAEGNQMLLRVQIPKGTKAINVDANFSGTSAGREGELILRPGTDFKVTGKLGEIERDGQKIPVYGVEITSAESRAIQAVGDSAMPSIKSKGTLGFRTIEGETYTADEFRAMSEKVKQVEKDWAESVTPGHKQAITTYQGASYTRINNYLRGKPSARTNEAWITGVVKRLDETLSNAVTEYDLVVHRGYGGASAEKLIKKFGTADLAKMPGTIIREDGYMSTTLDSRIAGGFGNVKVEIDIPAGSPAAYIPTLNTGKYVSESEVLLPRGTALEITHAERKGYQIYLRAKVVNDGSYSPPRLPTKPPTAAKTSAAESSSLDPESILELDFYKNSIPEAVKALPDIPYANAPIVYNKANFHINMLKSTTKKNDLPGAALHHASLGKYIPTWKKWEPPPKVAKFEAGNGSPGTEAGKPLVDVSGYSVNAAKLISDVDALYDSLVTWNSQPVSLVGPPSTKKIHTWLNEAAQKVSVSQDVVATTSGVDAAKLLASAKGKLQAAEKLLMQELGVSKK